MKESQAIIDENPPIVEKSSTYQIDSIMEHKASNQTEEKSNVDTLKWNEFGLMKNKIVDAGRNFLLVLMRQRGGKGRAIVWLLLFSNFLYAGCEHGKLGHNFYILQRFAEDVSLCYYLSKCQLKTTRM